MTDKKRSECESTFKQFDKSGDGILTIQEVAQVLRKMGANMSDRDVAELFAAIDDNSDKKVTFEEFWDSYKLRDPKTIKEDELRAAFKDLDKDNSGFLDKDDVKGILKGQVEVTDELCEEIINDVDKNNDGKINFEEFLAMWKSKS